MTKKKKPESDFHLEVPFEEAFERFIGVDPAEMQANIDKSKKKKPPDGQPKAKPSGGESSENVASLRQRRVRKRNTGH